MHNRACCYVTCNCQSKLSCRWICDSPILHVPRHAPFPDWPWVYAHLHFAQGRAKRRRPKLKREAKQDHGHSFSVNPFSCLGSVLSTVYLRKYLSAWAVTSLLFWIPASMRQEPRQELRNPACLSCSLSFQIFIMMRQELRERNKLMWQNK